MLTIATLWASWGVEVIPCDAGAPPCAPFFRSIWMDVIACRVCRMRRGCSLHVLPYFTRLIALYESSMKLKGSRPVYYKRLGYLGNTRA